METLGREEKRHGVDDPIELKADSGVKTDQGNILEPAEEV